MQKRWWKSEDSILHFSLSLLISFSLIIWGLFSSYSHCSSFSTIFFSLNLDFLTSCFFPLFFYKVFWRFWITFLNTSSYLYFFECRFLVTIELYLFFIICSVLLSFNKGPILLHFFPFSKTNSKIVKSSSVVHWPCVLF